MKLFFSIAIYHDYEKEDANADFAQALTLIPATTSSSIMDNNRLLFRANSGSINCYIEDNEAIENEVDMLFFWVICVDEAFYSYTDYPRDANFVNPYYYWSNSIEDSILRERQQCDLSPGKPPKNAIGCIGISLNTISEGHTYSIRFNVKKTYWLYHINFKESQKDWMYSIMDSIAEDHATEGHKKYEFTEVSRDEKTIIFQSNTKIPYTKRASSRLKLIWKSDTNFDEEHSMVLPFANYAYKMVTEDDKEVTPIYIYI